MKKFFILFCIGIFMIPATAGAVRIVWLSSGKGKDTFARGFSKMQDKLASESRRSRALLWDVLKIYADDQQVTFDDKEIKIVVKMHARATREHNTNTTCQALATKARTVLFGSNPLASLLEYFPGIKAEDLRYFVYLHGTVETFAEKNAKPGEELDPEDTPDPEETAVIASTKCRINAVTEKAYFD